MTKPYCRIYLISPEVAEPDAFAPTLKAAFAGGDVAALLLRLAPADERKATNVVKQLAPIVQAADAALIVAGAPAVAVRGGADGAQIDLRDTGDSERLLREAVEQLHPDRIAGAGGLKSRHIAMQAGEADVDYVMFGEPRPDGSVPDSDETLERAAWWAAIFATPCVAYAPTLTDVGPLALAGVEFVALGDAAWNHADGPGAAVAEALALIAANAPPDP